MQLYSDKNHQLTKEMRELQEKCKRMEQNSSKSQRVVESDKKTLKGFQNALTQLKEKDEEIEHLKSQLKTNHSIPSLTGINPPTPK